MKVIDLLNKIANGEEAPRKIKYCKRIYELTENKLDWYCDKNTNYFLRDEIGLWFLNFEVKILDKDYIEDTPIVSKLYVNNELQYDLTPKENKKIPEKLEYYDDSIAWVIDGVGQLSDVDKVIIDKLNEVLDYLKSKGE